MKAQDPTTGEWVFFVDKCLPFGASISCALFQNFSDTLCHLIEFRVKVHKRITNYLDDFLFLAQTLEKCNWIIQNFLSLFQEIGVLVSMEKTEWATELIVFLGILLDGRNFVLALPVEKCTAAVNLLRNLIGSKKSTIQDLQKLCGLLNFIGRAVFPGQTFTRRMYSKYSHMVNLGGSLVNSGEFKIKQHHHVRLDKEFKPDCKIWLQFLTEEMQSIVCRPMVDILGLATTSTAIKFYSDASASEKWGGFGAVLNQRWIWGDWNITFLKVCKPSIEYLELFALCAEVLTWQDQPELINCRIAIFCDNMAVVHMINSMVSSCRNCMFLLRVLVLNNLKYNQRLMAHYIDTKSNFLADALSRNQMTRFRRLGPHRLVHVQLPAAVP